jgi:hypothetical protein
MGINKSEINNLIAKIHRSRGLSLIPYRHQVFGFLKQLKRDGYKIEILRHQLMGGFNPDFIILRIINSLGINYREWSTNLMYCFMIIWKKGLCNEIYST